MNMRWIVVVFVNLIFEVMLTEDRYHRYSVYGIYGNVKFGLKQRPRIMSDLSGPLSPFQIRPERTSPQLPNRA